MYAISKKISKNQINDFISFAKTGKKEKLQKSIDMGINVLIDDAKAFILSARYGQLETLKILLNHLTLEKTNIVRHCFLESCNNNQRHIIDYLMDNYIYDLESESMKEIALKSCMVGEQNDILLYLCAKYEFNLNLDKNILEWALKNNYQEAYKKLEIIMLNKVFKDKKNNKEYKVLTNKI